MDHFQKNLPGFQMTFFKGGLKVGSGFVVTVLLNYIFTLIVSRTLGPSDFGIITYVISIAQILGSISVIGMDQGVVKFINAKKSDSRFRKIFYFTLLSTLAVSLVLAAILYFSASLVSTLFWVSGIDEFVRLIVLMIPFFALFRLALSVGRASGFVRYEILYQDIGDPLLRILLVCGLLVWSLSIEGVLISYIFTYILLVLFLFLSFTKKLPLFGQSKNEFELKELLRFSIPLTGVVILNRFSDRIPYFFIGYFSDAANVGFFAASFRIAVLIAFPASAFTFLFAPMFSKYYMDGNMEELKKIVKMTTRWILLITLPLTAIIIINANEFIALFGEEFLDAKPMLILLSIGYFIHSWFGPLIEMITFSGKSSWTLYNSLFYILLIGLLNMVLVPLYSGIGSAIAFSGAIVLVDIVRLFQVWKIFSILPFERENIKLVIVAALGLTGIFICKSMWVDSISGNVLYSILFFTMYSATVYRFFLKEEEYVYLKKHFK